MAKVYTCYATHNNCYKAAKKMTPYGFVLHSTGANNPNLKRYCNLPSVFGENPSKNYWDNPMPDGQNICVHDFIGYDKNKTVAIGNILPYNYSCWGCGSGSKGSYNYSPTACIQIEMCEDDLTNATYFNAFINAAVEHIADLCKKYGLNETRIFSHKEAAARGYASGHSDCDYWLAKFGMTMNDFRARVKAKLNGTTPTPVAPTTNGTPIIVNKQYCKYFYKSLGTCAKRTQPNRTTGVIKEKCTRGGYYPIKFIVTMSDGSVWLEHADTGLFTALYDTDKSKLFNATKSIYVKMGATDNLNIRSTPNGTKVGMLKFGESIYAFKGVEKIAGGYTWIKIMYNNGTIGWCAKKYLK